MEEQAIVSSDSVDKIELSKNKFILLTIFTFNLYSLWWTYKSWRFFKEREDSDIQPAMRALFSIFFLYGLFEKIKVFAESNGYQKSYHSGFLFAGILILSILGYLPAPFFLITLLIFTCYAPAVEALSSGIKMSNEYDCQELNGFNTRHILLLVIGGILWFFVLIGLFFS